MTLLEQSKKKRGRGGNALLKGRETWFVWVETNNIPLARLLARAEKL